MKTKAVVLLSGGLDSTASLMWAAGPDVDLYCLTFNYGQKNKGEIDFAKQIAKNCRGVVQHKVLTIPNIFEGSSLTSDVEVDRSKSTPNTYVPARNTIFLAYALAWAEGLGAQKIYIGATRNSDEQEESAYPDARPDYFKAFQAMATLATVQGREGNPVLIRTPVIYMPKAMMIKFMIPMPILLLTRSCYNLDDKGVSCGECDACSMRLSEFRKVGMTDPIPYKPGKGV